MLLNHQEHNADYMELVVKGGIKLMEKDLNASLLAKLIQNFLSDEIRGEYIQNIKTYKEQRNIPSFADFIKKEIAVYDKNKFHLIGIGGIGMSALARLLLAHDHPVSGSDLSQNGEIEKLKKEGAQVFDSHASQNIQGNEAPLFTVQLFLMITLR